MTRKYWLASSEMFWNIFFFHSSSYCPGALVHNSSSKSCFEKFHKIQSKVQYQTFDFDNAASSRPASWSKKDCDNYLFFGNLREFSEQIFSTAEFQIFLANTTDTSWKYLNRLVQIWLWTILVMELSRKVLCLWSGPRC